jgi:hypothetical protein
MLPTGISGRLPVPEACPSDLTAHGCAAIDELSARIISHQRRVRSGLVPSTMEPIFTATIMWCSSQCSISIPLSVVCAGYPVRKFRRSEVAQIEQRAPASPS